MYDNNFIGIRTYVFHPNKCFFFFYKTCHKSVVPIFFDDSLLLNIWSLFIKYVFKKTKDKSDVKSNYVTATFFLITKQFNVIYIKTMFRRSHFKFSSDVLETNQ